MKKTEASIYSGWTHRKGVYNEKAPAGIVLPRLLGAAPLKDGRKDAAPDRRNQSKR
jgi:hypothetical protein